MSSPSPHDPRLESIRPRFEDWSEVSAPPAPTDFMEAAVALVLRARESVELLLIRRAYSERDPWSGHMALPGGRKEAADSSLLHTAVRETEEETAVDLSAATVIGRLDLVAPVSPRLPKFAVTPLIFGVGADADAVVNSPEVARVHWAPIEQLLNPTYRVTTTIHLPDGPRDFPAYELDGQIVWGLTHRVLSRFAGRLEPGAGT